MASKLGLVLLVGIGMGWSQTQPQLLENGWITGSIVPSSCSSGNSPSFLLASSNGVLYDCINGIYVARNNNNAQSFSTTNFNHSPTTTFGLQEAVNAACAVGGGTVVIPVGSYILQSTVHVNCNNITIQGGGGGTCCGIGTWITRTGDFGDSIVLGSVSSAVNNFKLFDVSMTFDLGTGDNAPTPSAPLPHKPTNGAHLRWWNPNTVNIERCRFSNMVYNIHSTAGVNITVRDSQFGGLWDTTTSGLQVTKASFLQDQVATGPGSNIPTYITLDNNIFNGSFTGEAGPRQGVEFDNCEDCEIINGSMGGNNVNSILISGVDCGATTCPLMNIRISHVKFDSVGNTGTDVQIQTDGVVVPSQIIFDSNICNGENQSGSCLTVPAQGLAKPSFHDLRITNNTSYAQLSTPFRIMDGSGFQIIGNTIYAYNTAGTYSNTAQSSAIWISNFATVGAITGNQIGGNADFSACPNCNWGISLQSPQIGYQQNVQVYGNTISVNGLNPANVSPQIPTFSGATCGTGASINASSTDDAGQFTTGSGSVTSCVVVFYQNQHFISPTGVPRAPYCTVNNIAGGSAPAITIASNQFTVTTSTTGASYNWVCK
jgi:hypothetical protein